MKNKNLAAVLAFFFGVFGVHRFYLGQTGLGILYLVFFWTGITALIGLIDAIVFLSMDRDEFDDKYNRRYLNPDFNRYDTDYRRQRYRNRQRYDRDYSRDARQERREQRRVERTPPPQRRRPPIEKTHIPQRPKSNPYRKSGIDKYREYDYEGAIEDFKKALDISPRDLAVHFNLACAYSLMEEKENAFFHLNRAVEYGFVDFKRIQEHDALAYLRIQDEFDIFKRNGYRLDVAPPADNNIPVPPANEIPTSDAPTPLNDDKEDLLAKNNNLLEQIKQLGELREKGLLTDEEFEMQKRRLLD